MEPVVPELRHDHAGLHEEAQPVGVLAVAAYHVADHQSQPDWDSRATSSLYTAFVAVEAVAVVFEGSSPERLPKVSPPLRGR